MNLPFTLLFKSDTRGAEAGINAMERRVDGLRETLGGIGEELSGVFEHVRELGMHIGESIIETAAGVEKSEAMLKFAYREMARTSEAQWQHVKDQVSDASLYTEQTQQELTDMVASMKRVNEVNIFDPKIEAALNKEVEKRNFNYHNTTVLLAEVASGLRTHYDLTMGINAMMQGQFGRARRMMEPIAGHIDQYKKAMAGARDNTEKFERIIPLLVKDFGELTQIIMPTWHYMTNQVRDIGQKLASTFGRPMMEELKKPMREFISYWTDEKTGLLTHNNIHKLDGIAAAFGDIGRAIGRAAGFAIGLMKGITEFAMAHPIVIKIAGAIMGIAAGLASITSALVAIRLMVMAVGFAFGSIGLTILPIIAVLAGGMYFLAQMKLHGDGIADTFDRMRIVLSAAFEGLSHMTNGVATLSEETSKTVGEKGLMGAVTWVLKWGYRIERFFIGIKDGFMESVGFIESAFERLGGSLDKMFGALGETIGLTANTGSKKFATVGEKIGNVIAGLVGGFTYFMSFFIDGITFMIKAVGWVADKIGATVSAIKDVYDMVEKKGKYADANAYDSSMKIYQRQADGTMKDVTAERTSKRSIGGFIKNSINPFSDWNEDRQVDSSYESKTRSTLMARNQGLYNALVPSAHIDNGMYDSLDDRGKAKNRAAADDQLKEFLSTHVVMSKKDLIDALSQMHITIDGETAGRIIEQQRAKDATRSGNARTR